MFQLTIDLWVRGGTDQPERLLAGACAGVAAEPSSPVGADIVGRTGLRLFSAVLLARLLPGSLGSR